MLLLVSQSPLPVVTSIPNLSQSKRSLPLSLQNGSTLKPTRDDHDEFGGSNNNLNNNMSCLTEFQTSQSQWEELEMRMQ